jgi:hypothetical protein
MSAYRTGLRFLTGSRASQASRKCLALLAVLAVAAAGTSARSARADKKDPAPAPPPSAAPAPPPAATTAYSAEVLVLHATNSDKGIDPRIGEMPELRQPPFSSYKSYELLQKVKLPLKLEDPKTFDLPNGRVLQTKLLGVLPDGAVRISASINQPGGKTFLPLLEVKAKTGQPFIVAGQPHKAGILVLVIRVTK